MLYSTAKSNKKIQNAYLDKYLCSASDINRQLRFSPSWEGIQVKEWDSISIDGYNGCNQSDNIHA